MKKCIYRKAPISAFNKSAEMVAKLAKRVQDSDSCGNDERKDIIEAIDKAIESTDSIIGTLMIASIKMKNLICLFTDEPSSTENSRSSMSNVNDATQKCTKLVQGKPIDFSEILAVCPTNHFCENIAMEIWENMSNADRQKAIEGMRKYSNYFYDIINPINLTGYLKFQLWKY